MGTSEFTVVKNFDGLDFFGAVDDCRARGAELASIKSAEEQEFVDFLIGAVVNDVVNVFIEYYIGKLSRIFWVVIKTMLMF